MFILKTAFCRTYQTAFRLALPVLPYREPQIINSCSDIPNVLKKENTKSVLIVTDKGIVNNGLANAVIMPYVLEAYGKSAHKKLYELGIAAGVCGKNDSYKDGAKKFINAIKELNKSMGIPDKIEGIIEKDIPILSMHAEKEANPLYPVPKLMTQYELEHFYYQISDWSK